jgi:hypothetical protein
MIIIVVYNLLKCDINKIKNYEFRYFVWFEPK